MNKFQFILIFIVLIFISDINAQSLSDSTFHYKNTSFGKDLSTFFETGIKIYSSPARFTGKDWIITGSVLAATGLAFFADDDVRDFWLRNQSNSATDILNIMQIYGNVGFASALSVTVYAGGKIFKDPEIAATGRMLMEGVFYSGLTNTILKISTGRSRPYLNQGPYFFKPFQFTEPHISFPSGHVTMAFTLSSILSDRIDNIFVAVGLYSLASATFIQRMYSDNHWLSDCILGAATGYFTGKAVVKFDKEGNSKKLSVLPFYEQRTFGFRIIYPM